ncbi:MAG TPA: hypothetical protein VJI73_03650 [Candidatus Paceibacterota bacterium]
MNNKAYIGLTSLIFLIIAILHSARLLYGWPAEIGSFKVPIWISWLTIMISGYLSWSGFKLRKGL